MTTNPQAEGNEPMSRYTKLTTVELEADQAAIECALGASRRNAAMDTLIAIDGPLYGEANHDCAE